MADKIFAGLDASAIETVPKFDPITKVTVTNGENSWSRGDDTGRELRVELPIAKSTNGGTFAQNILAKVSGLQYQPYNASGALIDPAAEIGDGVTIGGVYGGIYEQNTRFNQLHSSNIGAAADEELDNEYPYLSSQERDAIRQKRQTEANTTAIETNADDIASNSTAISGVANRVSTLEANQITVNYLQANYCEINGATINNIKADIAEFRQIFAGQVQATKINTATLAVAGSNAGWYNKTSTSYSLILGR